MFAKNELSARVAKLLDMRMPGSLFDKIKKLGDLFDVAKAGPKHVRSAPCQEVVDTDRPSLATLPVLRCWPGDAGRFITLPMVFTKDPLSGARNAGMYRLQVFDDRTLGMHWQIHKGSAEHQRLAEEQRKPMDVAIALGSGLRQAPSLVATIHCLRPNKTSRHSNRRCQSANQTSR